MSSSSVSKPQQPQQQQQQQPQKDAPWQQDPKTFAVNIAAAYYQNLFTHPMFLRGWYDDNAILNHYDVCPGEPNVPAQIRGGAQITTFYLSNIGIPSKIRAVAEGIEVIEQPQLKSPPTSPKKGKHNAADDLLTFEVYCHTVSANEIGRHAKPIEFYVHSFTVKRFQHKEKKGEPCWRIVSDAKTKSDGPHKKLPVEPEDEDTAPSASSKPEAPTIKKDWFLMSNDDDEVSNEDVDASNNSNNNNNTSDSDVKKQVEEPVAVAPSPAAAAVATAAVVAVPVAAAPQTSAGESKKQAAAAAAEEEQKKPTPAAAAAATTTTATATTVPAVKNFVETVSGKNPAQSTTPRQQQQEQPRARGDSVSSAGKGSVTSSSAVAPAAAAVAAAGTASATAVGGAATAPSADAGPAPGAKKPPVPFSYASAVKSNFVPAPLPTPAPLPPVETPAAEESKPPKSPGRGGNNSNTNSAATSATTSSAAAAAATGKKAPAATPAAKKDAAPVPAPAAKKAVSGSTTPLPRTPRGAAGKKDDADAQPESGATATTTTAPAANTSTSTAAAAAAAAAAPAAPKNAWGKGPSAVDVLKAGGSAPILSAPAAVVAAVTHSPGSKDKAGAASGAAATTTGAAAAAVSHADAGSHAHHHSGPNVDHFDVYVRGLPETATEDDVYQALKSYGVERRPLKVEHRPSMRPMDGSIRSFAFCVFPRDMGWEEMDRKIEAIRAARIKIHGNTINAERSKDKPVFNKH